MFVFLFVFYSCIQNGIAEPQLSHVLVPVGSTVLAGVGLALEVLRLVGMRVVLVRLDDLLGTSYGLLCTWQDGRHGLAWSGVRGRGTWRGLLWWMCGSGYIPRGAHKQTFENQ